MRLVSALAALLLSATAANAVSLSWDTENPDFFGTTGGSNINETNNTNLAILRWGEGSPQSGYIFNAISGVGNLNPGDLNVEFLFGTFSHENFPIASGTGIDGTNLRFTFTVDGTQYTPTFSIDHNETPNTGPGCCNDIVTATPISDFLIEGQKGDLKYVVTLLPFVFSTREGQSNVTVFKGLASDFAAVPIPPAALLFAGGLAGIGAMARKRKARNV